MKLVNEAVELIKNDDGSFTFVVPSVDSKINKQPCNLNENYGE